MSLLEKSQPRVTNQSPMVKLTLQLNQLVKDLTMSLMMKLTLQLNQLLSFLKERKERNPLEKRERSQPRRVVTNQPQKLLPNSLEDTPTDNEFYPHNIAIVRPLNRFY